MSRFKDVYDKIEFDATKRVIECKNNMYRFIYTQIEDRRSFIKNKKEIDQDLDRGRERERIPWYKDENGGMIYWWSILTCEY